MTRAKRSRRPPGVRTPATDVLAVRLNGYAETSAIAVLLTEKRGLAHAVAKGAKRLSNGYRGPLDKCVLYSARLGRRANEGLFHLHSASVREAYPALRRDPARFCAASLCLEVASDLMRDNEPHPELFKLTVFALKVLDRAPHTKVGLAATLFLARAAELSGHTPEIESCVGCGGPLGDERPLLSATRGGVLHPDCGRGEPGAHSIAPETIALLARFWHRPAAELLAEEPAPEELRALRLVLEEWLEHMLERRFRAATPMERELARI